MLIVAALVVPTSAQADSGLTVSPTAVAFGDVPAGTTYYDFAKPLTLTNNGGSSVTLDSFSFTGGPWEYLGFGPQTCHFALHQVLASGDSCQIWPTAYWDPLTSPPAQLGAYDGVIHLTTDQGTTDVNLSANFVGAYAAQQKWHGWEIGVVGSTVATHTVRVTNLGNAPLIFNSVTLDTSLSSHPATPSFAIIADGCSGESVAPGASCPVRVSFGGESDRANLVFHTNAFAWYGPSTAGFNGTHIAPFHVARHSISAPSFTPGLRGPRPHGVSYRFTSSYMPVNMLLQITNNRGRVVRSWSTLTYFWNHHSHRPSVWWDGRDKAGHFVKPGTYHFRVTLSHYGYHAHGGAEKVIVKR